MAMTAISDDMFTEDVIANPYTYYGRLRAEDPVHWNEKYALWVLTRHDDVVWMTRHHELFSNTVFKTIPRPAFQDTNKPTLDCTKSAKTYRANKLIRNNVLFHRRCRRVS